ncbi:MAG: alpha/beta hydrolase [Lachnospiraceae bacterium]
MVNRYFDINDSGHSIRCKLYYNDIHNIQKLVLYGHGFGGHKDNKAAEKFADRVLSKDKGVVVMTFNWPCHGDDVKRKLILSDCGMYIHLIVQYINVRFSVKDIDVYATSFGGYLFLKYIAENGNPFHKIALRCPAVDMYSVITQSIINSEDFEKLQKGKDVLVGFDRKIKVNWNFLMDLKKANIMQWDYLPYADDILIIHGTKDEVVPFECVKNFADENVIEFIAIENADHRFMDSRKMDIAIQYIINQFEL